ncbi:MAG: hypothetical protein HY785_08795 [Oscillatoriophycideae cyanobacterium NC_groundwater_1537_Pr4_S-0.65um_50_18]|nr:hypothetical protein [Oscillatoriophycideae cyanobacterium NC_groundwater_1537_Pr4_S-0.65um_50_18]
MKRSESRSPGGVALVSGSILNSGFAHDLYSSRLPRTVSSWNQRRWSLNGDRFALSEAQDWRFEKGEVTQLIGKEISHVYDKSGKYLFQLEGDFRLFSSDNHFMATYSPIKREVYLYDQGGRLRKRFSGDGGRFSPDRKYFFVVKLDSPKSQYYELATGRIYNLDGMIGAHSPTERSILASFTTPQEVFNRTITTNYYRQLDQEPLELKGIPGGFSPDGQRILTIGSYYDNDFFYLYDSSGKLLLEVEGSIPKLSPNGQFIALPLTNGKKRRDIVNVYDLSGNQIIQVQGTNVDFREDGKLAVYSLDRKTVNICNLPNN